MSPYPAPTTEHLREIWHEILELDEIDDEASFFALSGKSIDAIRLVNRVRNVFGLEITVRTIFEAPTVIRLTESLRAMPSTPARPRLTGDRRSG
ncbi:acyl carrier protein [Streptomyces sp. NBC_01411]|uniref:acyl carrier protein n=1 Tax=Streptomyces sp. NBC_01411 TaxID=2903857 RepID=UPI00324615E1